MTKLNKFPERTGTYLRRSILTAIRDLAREGKIIDSGNVRIREGRSQVVWNSNVPKNKAE
jgi:hypothetical protein